MGARGLAIECPAFYMGRRLGYHRGRTLRRGGGMRRRRWRSSIVMTWPLASGFGRLGRTTTMDGLYSIWNIAWVAHALVSDPADLLDANIFYPHRRALTFSEANILGGVVASPVWWLTGKCVRGAQYRADLRVLLDARRYVAARAPPLAEQCRGGPSAILFAFCPYFFSHSAHIQLLMAGGIPLAMLALHRLATVPRPARARCSDWRLRAQALACAYYGIFAGLMVGYGALFLAASRRLLDESRASGARSRSAPARRSPWCCRFFCLI